MLRVDPLDSVQGTTSLDVAWSFFHAGISTLDIHLKTLIAGVVLLWVLAASYSVFLRKVAHCEPKDLETPLEGENTPLLLPRRTGGVTPLRITQAVVALLGFCALTYGIRSRIAQQTVYDPNDKYAAHAMQCGTPDCLRDEATCGVAGNASQAASFSVNGNAALDGTMCCNNLMLRMLIDVGDWLDTNNIEWYVTYGTLLGGTRDGNIIRWTDDVDITIPSRAGLDALRQQRDMPYRFAHYGVSMLRGCADYAGVQTKLPHHPSGNGAHMWIGEGPYTNFVSCEGDKCDGRVNPEGSAIPAKSLLTPSSFYVGRTAYYFMDVYSPPDESGLLDPACAAFNAEGASVSPSKEQVFIGGRAFPTHRNINNCLKLWYGNDFMTPKAEHNSDFDFTASA